MVYQTLYRKYRPSKWEQILGNDAIIKSLQNQIQSGKFPHAFLLTGTRGTGKTTTARQIARALNTDPIDIIELDAASNRGIDEIRQIIDTASSAPFCSQYKVYIIDEAHQLTKDAANSFLKTLEEPPSHCVFILATSVPEKILDTIRSRCQCITFSIPKTSEIKSLVQSILNSENIELNESVVDAISTKANGSYRDALTILEQTISCLSESIEEQLLNLGVSSFEEEALLLKAIILNNVVSIIKHTMQIERSGASGQKILQDLIQLAECSLILRFSKPDSSLLIKQIGRGNFEKIYPNISSANPSHLTFLISMYNKIYSLPVSLSNTALRAHLIEFATKNTTNEAR